MKVETVAEQLSFSTLRIQTETSVGTGFIVSHNWGQDKRGLFLVTNKHVVDGSARASLTFTLEIENGGAKVPALGQKHFVNLSEGGGVWTGHPSQDIDIAAMPLSPLVNHLREREIHPFFRSIQTDLIPDVPTLEDLDAVEEILFVGYPSGVYDQVNNLPVSRKGTTATHPSVDYNGQPIFLIDASVFPGSSGSPVLILNNGLSTTRTGTQLGRHRVVFLGVLSEVLYREEDGTLEFRQSPASITPVIRTREMLDLGLVYKARTVVETIDEILKARGELPS